MLIGLPRAARRCAVNSARGYHRARTPDPVPPGGARPRSGVLAQLLEVQVTLETAHDLVAQLAAVAHLDHGLSFGVDDLAPDLAVLEQLLLRLVAGCAVRDVD